MEGPFVEVLSEAMVKRELRRTPGLRSGKKEGRWKRDRSELFAL